MSIKEAQEVFFIEEEGLASVRQKIGQNFEKAVALILSCQSRVVITGIGKSGIVGQKISATMNSTGTPSFFLHPVEAVHGDLGMVAASDVIVAISYSGETSELNTLLASLKERGITIIAMTGGLRSSLALAADVVLDIGVPKEACPLGLAPTASTTATLAMGDALAVVLLNRKKFQEADFRKNHPGGSLGDRLKVKVAEVMLKGEEIPLSAPDDSLADAVQTLNQKNLGAVLVVDSKSEVMGIVTDGDIRRCVVEGYDFNRVVADIMIEKPVTIEENILAADALSIMQQHEITILPVVSVGRKLQGILHLHNLLGKGEFRFLV